MNIKTKKENTDFVHEENPTTVGTYIGEIFGWEYFWLTESHGLIKISRAKTYIYMQLLQSDSLLYIYRLTLAHARNKESIQKNRESPRVSLKKGQEARSNSVWPDLSIQWEHQGLTSSSMPGQSPF